MIYVAIAIIAAIAVAVFAALYAAHRIDSACNGFHSIDNDRPE